VAELRRVRPDEVPELTGFVGEVFHDDAMITWTFPAEGMLRRSMRFFDALDRESASAGWLWTVDEGAGVAAWAPPGFDEDWRTISATIEPEVHELPEHLAPRYDAFWEWIEGYHPREPHWYLDHIAVRPDRQGEGLGVALVDLGVGAAREDGVPAFLITSKPDNVGFYERRGFAVTASVDAPDGGPHLWFMRTQH
jgi:GNAT superfamily N-acetyltransferase